VAKEPKGELVVDAATRVERESTSCKELKRVSDSDSAAEGLQLPLLSMRSRVNHLMEVHRPSLA
jgi:hypothetical protein